MDMFVVIERINYQGEYIRGIYLTREEAEVRKSALINKTHSPGVTFSVIEMTVGKDVNPYNAE
jgi:hypothetical protein